MRNNHNYFFTINPININERCIINNKTTKGTSAMLTKNVNKGWNDSLCEFVLFPACKWHNSIFVSAHVCLPRIYFFWNRHQTYNAGYIHAFSVTFPPSGGPGGIPARCVAISLPATLWSPRPSGFQLPWHINK